MEVTTMTTRVVSRATVAVEDAGATRIIHVAVVAVGRVVVVGGGGGAIVVVPVIAWQR